MIVLPRQDPLLYPGRYDYPRGNGGILHEEVPLVECHSLTIRGRFRVETAAGMKPLDQVSGEDEIAFFLEDIRGYGPGVLVRSGESLRPMSPGEAWALGAGWLTPSQLSLSQMTAMSKLPVEHRMVMQPAGTFLDGGLRKLYGTGLQVLDSFQLRGLVRGCLFAIDLWADHWKSFDREEQHQLTRRMASPMGRFLAHLGLMIDPHRRVPLALRSSLISRLREDGLERPAYDLVMLPVTGVRRTQVKSAALAPGTRCRLLGLNVEGLELTRTVI